MCVTRSDFTIKFFFALVFSVKWWSNILLQLF